MDPNRFDFLTKTFVRQGSRRRLFRLLAALPAAGAVTEHRTGEADAAQRPVDWLLARARVRQERRQARRQERQQERRQDRQQERRQDRQDSPNDDKDCNPKSKARICAGKCGMVRNNCGKRVDCGPCTCATGCHPDCETCNPATGLCGPIANGEPCDDGPACTVNNRCENGVCVGGDPKDCDDDDPCTVDSCEEAAGGCVHEQIPGCPVANTCPALGRALRASRTAVLLQKAGSTENASV